MIQPATVTPEEFIRQLISDDLAQRRIAPETKTRYQYAAVVEELMRSIAAKSAAQPLWQDVLHTRYKQLVSMVEGFMSACDTKFWQRKPEPDARHRLVVLWRHRDLYRAFKEGTESEEACHVDKNTLSEIALDYLRQDARSGEFERLLVGSLTAVEIYNFGEIIKENPSRFGHKLSLDPISRDMNEMKLYSDAKGNAEKLYWLRLKVQAQNSGGRLLILFGLPIMGIVFGDRIRIEWLPAVCTAILTFVVGFYIIRGMWRFVRRLFWRKPTAIGKALQLFQKMVQAYRELQGPATSPTRCREVFARAADEGAAWDPSVFTILDGAIQRSPGRWG
jgi:hypothetical protein